MVMSVAPPVICAYVYICVNMCVCVFAYACMCACVYVCVYTHTHTHTQTQQTKIKQNMNTSAHIKSPRTVPTSNHSGPCPHQITKDRAHIKSLRTVPTKPKCRSDYLHCIIYLFFSFFCFFFLVWDTEKKNTCAHSKSLRTVPTRPFNVSAPITFGERWARISRWAHPRTCNSITAANIGSPACVYGHAHTVIGFLGGPTHELVTVL